MKPLTPKNILFFGSSMAGGGSERQLLHLLRGVRRDNWQPFLYLLYREGPLLVEVPDDVSVRSYWSEHRPAWPPWTGREHRRQVHALTRLVHESNAVLLYDRLFHTAMIAGPVARRSGVGRISTIVSPPSEDLVRSETRFRWIKRWLLKRSYVGADRLLAVSEGTADDAARYYGIRRDRIEVEPSPVDLHRIDTCAQEGTPIPLSDRTQWNVLCVGRLSPEKGQAELIEAFAKWKHQSKIASNLHLIGDGPLRNELERRAKSLRAEDAVVFHGHVDNPYKWMANCDLVVIPSRYEGFPNVLLETMACRSPFLVADCSPSVRQLVETRWPESFVVSNTVDSLARSLEKAAACRARCDKQVNEARAYVETHHALEPWLDRMQQRFEEVVRSRAW